MSIVSIRAMLSEINRITIPLNIKHTLVDDIPEEHVEECHTWLENIYNSQFRLLREFTKHRGDIRFSQNLLNLIETHETDKLKALIKSFKQSLKKDTPKVWSIKRHDKTRKGD